MLRLNDLTVGYYKPVLKDVSLTIGKSDIVGIVGLNGSGKSTLLRTLLGLLKPLGGNFLLDGKPLAQWSSQERARRVSLLDSKTSVAFPMMVKELLEVSLRLHDKRELFNSSLDAVDLRGFENRNLLELSSGEQRRAFIAHTLCSNSQIILLDEPFAHLDWSHQRGLAGSIKLWNEKFGTTFVLAAHELEWLTKLCPRICVLGRQRLIADGSPEKVFQNPEVCKVFAFQTIVDENPIDKTRRLTLGAPQLK